MGEGKSVGESKNERKGKDERKGKNMGRRRDEGEEKVVLLNYILKPFLLKIILSGNWFLFSQFKS